MEFLSRFAIRSVINRFRVFYIMNLRILVLLISLVLGFILLIVGSLGLGIAQSGLPPDSAVPKPIPNNTVVPPNPSESNTQSQSNALKPLPDIPIK